MLLQKVPRPWLWLFLGCAILFSLGFPKFEPSLAAQNMNAKGIPDTVTAKKLKEIINYGVLAPSTHNAQMWKVKMISEHEILVMLDTVHTLPQVDPENRESLISLGAFIENMAEAAPNFHLKAAVQILARQTTAAAIARVSFEPQAYIPEARRIAVAIKNRHTIRIPYLKKGLSARDRSMVAALGRNYRYFPLLSKTGQYLKETIISSTRQQVADDRKQAELAGMMRFSSKEANTSKDGLTPEMMGLSGIAKWFVTVFFNRDTVLSQSFRKQTVAMAQKQAGNCAGFLVISSPDNSAASLVNAGRDLERFLIQATDLKIAVQPMSAPLEESPWREKISSRIGISGTAQMILRIGYVSVYGKPVSKRRDVQMIVK